MIKLRPIKNSVRLGRYFAEETASMRWAGEVARFLKIHGRTVTRPDLIKAAAGYSPLDGQPLYQRRSSRRRLGWDIVFAPTKSISVAANVGSGGDRIVRAHSLSVESVFGLLAEPAASIRTRDALGLPDWETTASMLYTHVVHRTNREKEPHVNSHVLLMNTTLSPQNTLMALETGLVFERLAAMERVYNHELCRLLRLDGINAQMSEDGKATIPDIEGSKAVHSAFSKAHSRVVTQAVEIAEEIKAARHKGRLFPLHPTTLTAVSRQIANDRHRPPKESGIEKKITRAHWRHSIDRACLELIDQASQSRKGVRLSTVRNQNTQSVFLPSIVAEHTSSEFPHKAKRHITAVQVLIRCTTDTPDLSARLILETALKYSAKICDRAKREEMESHIKAGLALTGVRILNTLESTDKIKATDPVLGRTLIARVALETALKHSAKICERPKREDMESHIKAGLALTGVRVLNTLEPTDKIKATDPHLRRTLIARVAPAMRRLRLASSIDKASEKYNQRNNGYSSTALSSALTQHFDTVRTAYVHH